ncbi:MAG: hypothetical protein MI757_22640 [Pirellulales bacterium]|nr:hypothetical protein [Pirellulales bacterium]
MKDTEANRHKKAQLEHLLNELLVTVLQRGYFGTASIEVVVSDGTIQSLRQRTEQMHR